MEAEGSRQHSIFNGVQIGTGTWAWGDRMVWGFGQGYQENDLKAVFEASMKAGIHLFDTAEVYGQGKSETYLGQFLREAEQPAAVATKFMPYPWRLSRASLLRALRGSLRRLGVEQVALYQIHMPLPPVTVESWMEAMLEAVHAGLTQAVGVSNYDRRQTQRAVDTLAHQGVRLASNQVEYHLLNRKVETSGLLKQCMESGVKVIAYSPLAMGLLTGKYGPDRLPSGFRGGRTNRKSLAAIQPLIALLRRIGADHAGKTPAQVALNWVICKGALPIPGAKTLEQMEQNAGAVGWALSEAEVAELDEMSARVSAA